MDDDASILIIIGGLIFFSHELTQTLPGDVQRHNTGMVIWERTSNGNLRAHEWFTTRQSDSIFQIQGLT